MPILRQLNLTDAQRDQSRRSAEERHAQSGGQAPARTLFELQQSLQAAVFADTPDTAQIDQLRANIAEAEAGHSQAHRPAAQDRANPDALSNGSRRAN